MALAAAKASWGRSERTRPAPAAPHDDDAVLHSSEQTRQMRLHLWLRKVELFKHGAGIQQALLVEDVYEIVSTAFGDRPIWDFIVEYLRPSAQRSSVQVLQSRTCGPILGCWKIVGVV